MRKTLYCLVVAVAMTTLLVGVSFAAEVKVGAVVEIVYGQYNIDPAGSWSSSDIDVATFGTTDADIDISIAIDDNTSAALKIDADDNTNQLEEVYIKFKSLGGSPVGLKIGKQEVPFGMDKDIVVTDGYMHNSGSAFLVTRKAVADLDGDGTVETNGDDDLSIANFGEVDNKFGFTFIANPAGDSPTIELSVFQDNTGQGAGTDADKPADDGISQSYALRLTSTRVKGLKAEVSYINTHLEGNKTTTTEEDSAAFSIGLDYCIPIADFFAEYISGTDLGLVKDLDQEAFQVGAAFKANKNITIVAQYNQLTYDQKGVTANPTVSKFSLTPIYTLDNGVELALEYVAETYDFDSPGVGDIDASGVFARVKFKVK